MCKSVSPPSTVREMKQLDRGAFRTTVQIYFVEFKTRETLIRPILAALKPHILKLPKLKSIKTDDRNAKKIYLDPQHFHSANVEDILRKNGLQECEFRIGDELVELNYDNWTAEDIFKAVLPEPSSFSSYSCIGHIAHLNLRENLQPYKMFIGNDLENVDILAEVLLDKMPRCKTVINKVDIIENEYRNLKFEHLVGERLYVTRVRENGHVFDLDFSKVYWNPRLGTEHARLVSKFAPGDVVFDVFAGVGPFSIPAAAKRCTVIANDLNSDCIAWLQRNCQLNKVSVEAHSLDGKKFLMDVCPKVIASMEESESAFGQVHVVMNLPATAIDFLPSLSGMRSLLGASNSIAQHIMFVHCYTFCKADDPIAAAKDVVQEKFSNVPLQSLTVHDVRVVSPFKHMLCVSFILPAAEELNV
ncbi:TRM5 tRNA methyltransferase 5 [Trichuris trichiura]|uniref:tRNA (guanine(37)-N1)-methyltransferase n=1 Tax=Trichuris trichiura TaxID=36087 RepID=A0A077Z475_TRITR|nr:TRM5 tRNA methyltransferase 5 [Trichuris trichiura]